jgi:hypothetical protein
MKYSTVFVSLCACAMATSFVSGQEIQTFDSPNQTQTTPTGNFKFANPVTNWTVTPNATNVEVAATGYGTAYHNIFTQDTPNTIDISGSTYLQLDFTLNSGVSGLIVDLQDGEGDFWTYHLGYGLTGNAVTDQAALPSADAGTIITQGAAANEEIIDTPLATPASTGGTSFDFTQLVLFRLEDDPGGAVAYDVSFNDLSAVNVPEPTSIGFAALGLTLLSRRRH